MINKIILTIFLTLIIFLGIVVFVPIYDTCNFSYPNYPSGTLHTGLNCSLPRYVSVLGYWQKNNDIQEHSNGYPNFAQNMMLGTAFCFVVSVVSGSIIAFLISKIQKSHVKS